MNLYAVPMLISGILCMLLAIVTWLFRRRERINRIFSFFTLALALDAFAFFAWFQFGTLESIHTWMRLTFSAGFIVPAGLILFFLAFTGYDKNLSAKIMGIRVKHFLIVTLTFIFITALLSQFTDLVNKIPENPQHIWDTPAGPLGILMLPIFALIFLYLFTMAYKSYRKAESLAQQRFILILIIGTSLWILFGYVGALAFPVGSKTWSAISYLGTGIMAVFYFVAIVNFQSDKVHALNIGLEEKVAERTRELSEKNIELEDAFNQLKEMQKQIIVQEKMASLGQLVAGLTHEFNTPIGAMRSMQSTKSKALKRLEKTLADGHSANSADSREINKMMKVISDADQLIDEGTGRLHGIIENLKNFVRLDESETVKADIHDGIESVLSLLESDILKGIQVTRNYGVVPEILSQPRKLNQVYLNIIKNAAQATTGKNGRITVTTVLQENSIHISIRDNGKGIEQKDLTAIFEPGFTTKNAIVRARLGLAISLQIVQEHQGSIQVDSEPGKGSVFTIILPVEPLQDAHAEN